MKLYSTNNRETTVELKQAVLQSLAPDKGLYMPVHIPTLPLDFIQNLDKLSFQELSFVLSRQLIGNYIPSSSLAQIIDKAINFPAPVNMLSDDIGALELWHGPSLAFKDFGARFMAELMAYFIKDEDKKLTILVATSGDTGGAVAAGFYKTPGIEVIILYPSGKVSDLQEKQLTTLGENITAIEVNGTFDDCQAMVKSAFLDQELNSQYQLSSANSINIARLIPQSFYYFEAYKQVMYRKRDVIFSVPSGNFGNLTAGLIAFKMGLPVKRFIAATNINKIVPDYLSSGVYLPKPSISTISNAMDVGNPSNFVRMLDLYHQNYNALTKVISGFCLDDAGTIEAMKEAFIKYGYICDPHGAIAFKSLQHLSENEMGIFLETAHPAKFKDTVESALACPLAIPEKLAEIAGNEKNAVFIQNDFLEFKSFLRDR